jgi:hypothetical protein
MPTVEGFFAGVMMIVLLLFLQKQNLANTIYLFGLGTLLSGLGLKHMRIRSHHDLAGTLVVAALCLWLWLLLLLLQSRRLLRLGRLWRRRTRVGDALLEAEALDHVLAVHDLRGCMAALRALCHEEVAGTQLGLVGDEVELV